ncbi:hypothetical protein pb186bvf_016415 [Paramecium bursaria]
MISDQNWQRFQQSYMMVEQQQINITLLSEVTIIQPYKNMKVQAII